MQLGPATRQPPKEHLYARDAKPPNTNRAAARKPLANRDIAIRTSTREKPRKSAKHGQTEQIINRNKTDWVNRGPIYKTQ